MNNWAIVIGVNEYPNVQSMNLKGAVRDALEMATWLLGPGKVAPAHMCLLLSPLPNVAIPPGVIAKEATHDTIVRTIYEMIRSSGGLGDRFFFHYSGHGLTSRIAFSDEEALIPSDFEPLLTTKSISFRSILEQFEATQFHEQFFFFDACRNMPWEIEFDIGKLPLPAKRDPDKPSPQQFVTLATSPGLKAAEIALVANEAGAFTDAVLAGLKGDGRAKAWDPALGKYVVRYDRLFDYVVATVASRQLPVGQNNRRVIQIPKRSGEVGLTTGNNPILAEIEEAEVAAERLEIVVDPFQPPHDAHVKVRAAFDEVGSHPVSALPFRLDLKPRDYLLQCDATGYEDVDRSRRVIELYQTQKVDVHLKALAQPPTMVLPSESPAAASSGVDISDMDFGPGLAASPSPDGWSGGEIDFGSGPESSHAPRPARRQRTPATASALPATPRSDEKVSLVLRSSDAMAPIELLESTGRLVDNGLGQLTMSVKPGLYRARVITPEKRSLEQWVTVHPGEPSSIHLHAPDVSAGIQDLAEATQFRVLEDNTIEISETVGPLASAELSTILALAAVTAHRMGDAFRLREIGVDAFATKFAGADRGLQCLVGDEGTENDPELNLLGARVGLWHHDDPVPDNDGSFAPIKVKTRIGQFAQPMSAGPHWLSLSLPFQSPIVLNVVCLYQRMMLVIVHRMRDDSVAVYTYMPPIGPAREAEPRDVRVLELMERYYAAGTYDMAKRLLLLKPADPTFGAVGAYVLMRLGRSRDLGEVRENMLNMYSDLPDSHIIAAAFYETLKSPNVEMHYRNALDHGFPIFAEGLGRLVDAVERFGIDHPRVPLLRQIWNRRVQGMLWTAWSPQSINPGVPLGT